MRRHLFWLLIGLACLYLIYVMVSPFVDVIVYSVFAYYISRPIYRRLKGRIASRAVSAFVSLFIIILPAMIVVTYAFSVGVYELGNLLSAFDIPFAETVNRVIIGYNEAASQVSARDVIRTLRENNGLQDMASIAGMVVTNSLNIILRMMLTLSLAAYMLMDGAGFRAWLVEVLYPRERGLTIRFLNAIDSDLHKVFYGSIQTAMFISLMGVIVATALNAIAPRGMAIPYTLLFGMICGVASLVPMIGVSIFYAPATAYFIAYAWYSGLLATGWWFIALFFCLVFIFVDWGPNLVFKPHITGKNVHPGLMMFAYLLGPLAFGVAGIFLGPIVLVVTVNFAKILLPRMR